MLIINKGVFIDTGRYQAIFNFGEKKSIPTSRLYRWILFSTATGRCIYPYAVCAAASQARCREPEAEPAVGIGWCCASLHVVGIGGVRHRCVRLV